ncbi:MAG: ribonuclease H-like domain-containing protein [Candidatus Eisenbacteria bacterium]|nr:ribonuclease H-like domain-containing protein [Candidatus Eisenbacteria bacterium]
MASERMKERLQALKRGTRGAGGAGAARAGGTGAARPGARAPARANAAKRPAAARRAGSAGASVARSEVHIEPVGVEVYLPGGEIDTAHGPLFLHERRRSELDKFTARFLRRLDAARKRALKLDLHEQLAKLLDDGLGKALFLDLETAGLVQCPVFLTGVMVAGRNDWILRQYFARHYAEEKALIRATIDLLDERPNLVTFNGRSFDWPMIKTRAAYHRLKVPADPFHVDLLPHSRRHWRGHFENCRLQTLEWKVVGRRRMGDVPGSEIPGRYHRYVKNGDPYPLVPVFHHNMLDLVTMADLLVEMLELEVGA